MHRFQYSFQTVLAASTFAAIHAGNACELPTTLSQTVTAVSDSRSLKLDDGSELQLAAILAPTPYDTPAAPKIWPPETAALNTLSTLSLNRSVTISLERKPRDRYGRLVGQVLLAGDLSDTKTQISDRWLQARMVRAGHARVALTPEIDATCATLLLRLEATAETGRVGLWSNASYRPKRAEDIAQLRRYRSTFQIVEGVVTSVSIRRSTVYLNFGENWKKDFTVKLSRGVLRRAKTKPKILKKLHKTPLRVRGWLEQRNGPLITVWRLEQIERLALTTTGETRRHSPPSLLSELQHQSKKAEQ